MGTKLYKDGDQMGIWTDAIDEREFLDQVAQLFNDLIEHGWCISVGSTTDGAVQAPSYEEAMACDWEFQFNIWIPQIVEICCKYRGYKSDVNETRVLFYGNILPKDFIAEIDNKRGFLFRKESQ